MTEKPENQLNAPPVKLPPLTGVPLISPPTEPAGKIDQDILANKHHLAAVLAHSVGSLAAASSSSVTRYLLLADGEATPLRLAHDNSAFVGPQLRRARRIGGQSTKSLQRQAAGRGRVRWRAW
jgi:hypothetical protein